MLLAPLIPIPVVALIVCAPLLLLRMQFPSLRILARPGLFMIALLLLSTLVGGGVIAPPLLVLSIDDNALIFDNLTPV